MGSIPFDMRWFLDHYEAASEVDAAQQAAVAQAVAELLADLSVTWDGLDGCAQAFIGHLATHMPADAEILEALGRVRAADLLLAYRCGCGDAAALAVVEREYMRSVRATVLAMRASVEVVDEVAQLVRAHLFVRTDERRPRVLDYSGRGDLHSWLRAIAGRTYLNYLRRQGREVPVGDAALLDAVSKDAVDPELAHMKQRYRSEFRRAFVDALESLPDKDKNLLRYRYIDELGIGALAALYKVHRATLHRWLADARDVLARTTERLLRERLAISETEFESIRRLVVSQLDVSLRRVLGGAT